QADLKILDPIWTTAFITRDHGYMIYDTLFGVDAKGAVRPEMVDTYTGSADGKTWTFTLRKGLAFSDGKPVTPVDVIASITRWGKRDVFGQKMFAALESFDAVNAKTFRMTFKQPFPMVLEALGKPSGSAAFIMPKRVADTPADQQISEYIGSGPYILKLDEYRPGAKIVYIKNPNYVPRQEPASGTAGGKHVHVDRVEWIVLKDAQTQANAIA
ncbi:ABC transporter substrate-binding protein, partial [Cupriavidus sp. CuC1]|uniref:ABC transporter substrate-binding protein n=1 Tax=Cupriavidus sp. CuC1 TaxID=3373131 RepID=UPI0037D7D676